MAEPVSRRNLPTAIINPPKEVAKVEVQEITMQPGVPAPLHLHPCPTIGVVSKGSIAFQIEGQEVQYLQEGDSFYEPANVRVAKFNNEGDTEATFIAFYLLGDGEGETVRILDN